MDGTLGKPHNPPLGSFSHLLLWHLLFIVIVMVGQFIQHSQGYWQIIFLHRGRIRYLFSLMFQFLSVASPVQSAALSRLYIWPTILVYVVHKIAPNIKMVEVL